ncbi:hypothetical protein ACWDTP_12020 [Mycobacterium sp. NPDC003449]
MRGREASQAKAEEFAGNIRARAVRECRASQWCCEKRCDERVGFDGNFEILPQEAAHSPQGHKRNSQRDRHEIADQSRVALPSRQSNTLR